MGGVVGMMVASTALAASPFCRPNGVVEVGEGCDPVGPVFRNGATCQTFGYEGGTLACTSTCQVDDSGCFCTPGAVFPGDGVDGPKLSYTDNNDGTFTDNNTLFMWEKKDTAGGIHDVGNSYTWSDAFAVFLAALNTPPCFADHCDWRIPNVEELQSIVDYGRLNPASSVPGSTAADDYWSSTADAGVSSDAWGVNFSTAT